MSENKGNKNEDRERFKKSIDPSLAIPRPRPTHPDWPRDSLDPSVVIPKPHPAKPDQAGTSESGQKPATQKPSGDEGKE